MLTVVVAVLVVFEVYNNLVNLLASLQKVNTALSLYSCPSAYSNTQILMARARDGQSGLGVIYTFAQSSRAEPRITDVFPNKMGE